ncbi:hypothetical protein GCM10023351_21330 [Microbacterium gilvum]|uniref:Uncharacterized protein n=1 Tax=Microbacterium gilvum TaxID=1336204 RepID=A0ABP9A8F3_9MICO
MRKLPPRILGSLVGGLIVLTNTRTILRSIETPDATLGVVLAAIAVVWIAAVAWSIRAHRRARRAERAGTAEAAAAEPALVD